MARAWDERADELASVAIESGEPTSWFDRLYGEGERGEVSMPWDRRTPNPVLEQWARSQDLSGDGRRAVVVGCGLGADAEYLASLGFAVTAFDVSPTAVRLAAQRNPGSRVDYRQADLLDLPEELVGAFDLVVEIFTLQALPDPPRASAVPAVRSLVAPGGTLFVVALRSESDSDAVTGPPFALGRGTLHSVAAGTLELDELVALDVPLWQAVLRDHRA
ncbi:class I SAM-dependent methyltransferase [Monashia sp. NPDC004114]